jgi:hypothetical protein
MGRRHVFVGAHIGSMGTIGIGPDAPYGPPTVLHSLWLSRRRRSRLAGSQRQRPNTARWRVRSTPPKLPP